MAVKISYFVVFVKDMEASLSFYRDLLGLEVAYRTTEADGSESAFVVEPGEVPMKRKAMIELVALPKGAAESPSSFIIGLEMESIADKAALLRERGYRVTKEPFSPDSGYLLTEFVGPNGEGIGLMQVEAWRREGGPGPSVGGDAAGGTEQGELG